MYLYDQGSQTEGPLKSAERDSTTAGRDTETDYRDVGGTGDTGRTSRDAERDTRRSGGTLTGTF